MALLEEFRQFLGSVKTSESISNELRKAISVETGLEKALADALLAGRDVIIAGSAGGGKTHLLGTLADSPPGQLPRFVDWPSEAEPTDEPFIRVVSDATAIPSIARGGMFERRPSNCAAVAIAINEGPLLSLAHEQVDSAYAKAVKILHAAQRGIALPNDISAPVILDVGGYDPVENDVIAKLLGLELVRDLVEVQACSCSNRDTCFRKLAWDLLKSDTVRKRANDLLRVVNMLGQSVLFRDLWDFVADLVLGGTCEEDPPTSPWFWRMFYGDNALSVRLREIADPALVIYPRAEAHIWYGDWTSSELELEPGIELIEIGAVNDLDSERYRWVKSQIFFLVRSASATHVLRDLVDLQLTRALETDDVISIVRALNSYMTYGTILPKETSLELWTDLGVEKRTDRPKGQASLGTIPAADLILQQSLAVANHPDPQQKLYGSRHFLVHRKTAVDKQASFALSPEVLNLLQGGRSYRTADRPHTDLEWHLGRFFASLADAGESTDQLDVMEIDFKSMTGSIGSYRIATELSRIEPLGRVK